MNNIIKPYGDSKDIAIIDRELSVSLQKSFHRKESDIIRLTDIYLGRYGIFGYVEMNVTGLERNHTVDVGGIIEIPGSLVDAMGNIPGMTGYIKEVIFRNQNFTENVEALDHPSLEGVKLFDEKYFWHPLGYHYSSPLDVASYIKDNEEDVIKFIIEFEKVLDRFMPAEKKPTLEKLLSLGTTKILQLEE